MFGREEVSRVDPPSFVRDFFQFHVYYIQIQEKEYGKKNQQRLLGLLGLLLLLSYVPKNKQTNNCDTHTAARFGRVESSLKMGIVGLPNVGKSSLFNLLKNSNRVRNTSTPVTTGHWLRAATTR